MAAGHAPHAPQASQPPCSTTLAKDVVALSWERLVLPLLPFLSGGWAGLAAADMSAALAAAAAALTVLE